MALQTAVDDAIATAGKINEILFTLGTQTVQGVIGAAAQQATTAGEGTYDTKYQRTTGVSVNQIIVQ